MFITRLTFVALLFGGACAKQLQSPHSSAQVRPEMPSYTGPDSVHLDLLRTSKGGPRIFVQVDYTNGEKGLFMVDTGAAISTLSESAAEHLNLPLQLNYGSVEGLGGTSSFHRTVMPSLALGKATLQDVEFAVGVRGIPKFASFMPLDGILGNNVWSHFVVEVDYLSDTLGLHRPYTVELPGNPTPMFFDGSHVFAPIGIQTPGKTGTLDEIVMEVDTGASELLLSGPTGNAFDQQFSQGVEPIFGIGASEYMPASMFLQTTRRIPVATVHLGGKKIRRPLEAKWLNFSERRPSIGPAGMRGLIGHELLSGHSVWFDYAGARFVMVKSTRSPRQINGHQILLEQDKAKYSSDPSRRLFRAKMLFALNEKEDATEELEMYLRDNPTDSEATVLLAKVRRLDGDPKGSWEALQNILPVQLVDENEIVSAVNGLILEGHMADALTLAQTAVESMPENAQAQVALADALLAEHQLTEANKALLSAARSQQNPDANLLRRARVAMASGDRYGALAKVRRLIQLYPTEGTFLWFYSTLVADDADRSTFEADMKNALARLHPGLRPFDFMVAAHHSLGNQKEVAEYLKLGIERDCKSGLDRASRDNCYAWYNALAGRQHADSLERIERALSHEGDRSDFLDTRAMVHLSRGEWVLAEESAIAAARLNPDDVYMLWQAERIASMRRDYERKNP